MKQYAEITDKGECYSSLSLNIEGVNANVTEWNKHNFYTIFYLLLSLINMRLIAV